MPSATCKTARAPVVALHSFIPFMLAQRVRVPVAVFSWTIGGATETKSCTSVQNQKQRNRRFFYSFPQKVSLCKIAESQCFCCYHSRCNVRGHKNLNREVHSNNLHQQIWCHFIVQLCSKNGEDNGSTDGLHDHLRQLECSLASFW